VAKVERQVFIPESKEIVMSGLTKQTYSRYWSGLIDFMKRRGYLPLDWNKAISGTSRQRIYSLKGDDVRISAGASPGAGNESPYIQVDLTVNPNEKAIFISLNEQRSIITKEINSDDRVFWEPRGSDEENWVRTQKYAVPQNERDWNEQYEWLAKMLIAFNDAFKKRV
jgi:Domain of unknown function (DUF4268)